MKTQDIFVEINQSAFKRSKFGAHLPGLNRIIDS